MDLYVRNMLATPNIKYANSSSNYYVIMMVQNLKKKPLKLESFQFFSHSRGIKCRPKANNNREVVVVCARYAVKRPSKRSVLVYIKSTVEALVNDGTYAD